MQVNTAYLLSLDPDMLLWSWRVNAGLPPKGRPAGGWEAPKAELRGHFLGHWLSATAMTDIAHLLRPARLAAVASTQRRWEPLSLLRHERAR